MTKLDACILQVPLTNFIQETVYQSLYLWNRFSALKLMALGIVIQGVGVSMHLV